MRFAEFELDSVTGELRRNGHPVRLERIPMQLLCLLASRPGELVSRAEIIERLWGNGVFLDTDNGINTAVRKIRIALHDDPEHPRFLVTLPGRGYRFVGKPLDEAESQLTSPSVSPSLTPPMVSQASSNQQDAQASSPASRSKIAPAGVIFGGVLLLCASLAVASYLWLSTQRGRTKQGRVMIAVLPFVNMSGDPAQDYFADGMTEEMITQLGALNPEDLGVIARTSAMHYKNSTEDVAHIAQELGVDYVLEGSVRRDGNEIRVTAQLIQAKDQTHIWAEDYDRQMSNVLGVQTAIATAIARQISISLPAPKNRFAPINAEAYDAYLRGTQDLEQRTRPALEAATAELTRAVSLDPQYAPAWAVLSRTYSISPVFQLLPSNVALPKARDAALRALALDEDSSVAHCTLAFVMAHYDFDWPGAEREFQRAIALNPSDPENHLFYSNSYLSPLGRHDEAIAEMKTAITLDPLSFPIQSFFGRTLTWAGRTHEALDQFAKVTESNPNSALEHVRLAHIYSALGQYEEAIGEEEKARILAGEDPEIAVAKGQQLRIRFRKEGARGYWEQELQYIKQPDNPPESYTGAYGLAILYAQLGDRDKSMTALNEAFKEHDLRLTEIGIEPLFKPLREDPLFIDLETRIGLNRNAN